MLAPVEYLTFVFAHHIQRLLLSFRLIGIEIATNPGRAYCHEDEGEDEGYQNFVCHADCARYGTCLHCDEASIAAVALHQLLHRSAGNDEDDPLFFK